MIPLVWRNNKIDLFREALKVPKQMDKHNNGPKIQKEMETVAQMIKIYCRRKHHHHELCGQCQDLKQYAHKRLGLCPFGEDKGACSNCSIHCYQPQYRTAIKKVMRYSGPWM